MDLSDLFKDYNFQWNKEVIDYIENERELTLGRFFSFLKKNNLPIKIEWVYYCLGKTTDNSNNERENFLLVLKGEMKIEDVFPEIYFFKQYILMELCNNQSNLVIKDFDSESFIKDCWDHVKWGKEYMAQEEAYDIILDCQARNYEDSGDGEYSSYCSSCHQSPCICGDPDEYLNR
jgi:hypothetical protein